MDSMEITITFMNLENYSEIKRLILSEILGAHSTGEMSKKLGFKADQYKRWLNGDKIFRWSDFEVLSEKLGLNLAQAFGKVIPSSTYTEGKNAFSLLKEWSLNFSNNEVANFLNCHLSVVKRYNQGKTAPDFETILRMIDFRPNLLNTFISELMPEEIQGEELRRWLNSNDRVYTEVLRHPLIPVIESIVGIESYKKRDKSSLSWIVEKVEGTNEEVAHILQKLLELGILSYDESTDTYISAKKVINIDGKTFQDHIPSIVYLHEKYMSYIEKKKDPDFRTHAFPGASTYTVYALDLEKMKKVNDIILKAHNDIMTVAREESQLPEVEVRGILLETFSLAL